MKILFATQNINKQREVQFILGRSIEIISLSDLNYFEELPETHFTLKENAEEKAVFAAQHFYLNCFAEDTGLEIPVLNNEPGVFSARYAGDQKNNIDNINLVLEKMQGVMHREAHFKTVVCLVINEERHFFEGNVSGKILNEPKGSKGFGYDSIFCADGSFASFAELDAEEKNRISHRRIAIDKMKTFLEKLVITKI